MSSSIFRFFLLTVFLLAPSCSVDDDDDTTQIDDDDSSKVDDDDTDDDDLPEGKCRRWDDCEAPLACHQGDCVEALLPKMNPWATDRATYDLDEKNILISGKTISPVGQSVIVGTQPTRVFTTPDGKYAVANESTWGSDSSSNRGIYYLQVIDVETMQVVDKLTPISKALWHGLQMLDTPDGVRLWATDGPPNNILQFSLDENGKLAQLRELSVPDCFTTGIIVNQTETRAYVTCLTSNSASFNGKLAFVNLETGESQLTTGLPGAFTPILSKDESKLFVASISTTARPANGDVVWVFDTTSQEEIAEIPVGLGPEGMVFHPSNNDLYVACNQTDDIHVIDADTLQVKRVISMHDEPAPLKGMYPVWLEFSPDGAKLYITASHENAIVVMDVATEKVDGMIPTAWYPNDLAVTPDGRNLIVSAGRGVGEGPANVPGPDRAGPGRTLRGSISKIEIPDAPTLATYTAQVVENNNRQSTYFDFSGGNNTPIPDPDAPLVASDKIKHVFFVLKENMAYDSGYGDLEIGEGDPEYALWGEENLRNQWKIAREHVLFDNFYCLADSSIDGHQWPSAGIETDFIEKYNWHAINHGFGTIAISLTPGTQPESLPIMPHLIEAGVSVLGFGGIENFGLMSATTYAPYLYNGYDHLGGFGTPDWERAETFRDAFHEQLEEGTVPAFTWIFIGNNHGHGLRVGEPTPDYWIRENDLAVGIIVDAISKSEIWDESLIFITEDDSQNGHDHIDKHRCAAVALSPWLKRNYVSSAMYTVNNFQKTLELIFGVGPMHRLDEAATAMYDIFVARPDPTPIEAVLDPVPREDFIYRGKNAKLLEWSARMDWSDIDLNPDSADFYWAYKKGTPPPDRGAFYKHRKSEED